MHYLDDKEGFLKNDPQGMYQFVVTFVEQCEEALKIGNQFSLPSLPTSPRCVVFTGQGGSAIGGEVIQCLFSLFSNTLFFVNRDYRLPHFVDRDTLVFACSYSGNTEETLSAYEDALKKGAKIIALTSGGQLAERARYNETPLILIPTGRAPRASLGYLFLPFLIVCERLKLIPAQNHERIFQQLRLHMNHWVLETPFDHNLAKQTAEAIFGKLPLFYGLGSYPGVAAHRWKAQMNENAKIMAFANVFPELNHNEIMGWLNADKQGVHQWLTVILEGEAVSSRMHAGAQITADLIHEKTQILRIRAKGNSVLENMLYLITLGDFVSVYLAFLYKTDPTHVSLIRQLKERMSKAS